jgi:hypothetical protein
MDWISYPGFPELRLDLRLHTWPVSRYPSLLLASRLSFNTWSFVM